MMLGVDNKQMNAFVNYLLDERKLTVKSTCDTKSVLTNILHFGSMNYDIPLHAYRVEYPSDSRSKSGQLRFFSKEQCAVVFKAMEDDPSSELLGVVIGLTTGMRIGEITGLRFGDVDFDRKTVEVSRTITRVQLDSADMDDALSGVDVITRSDSGRSFIVANSPKTPTSHRTCPLTAFAVKWIKNYAKSNTPDRYIVGLGKKPIEPRTYRSVYYKLLDRLGLPALHPHCMRHTFATQMLRAKVDPPTIASILGHSSPAVTLGIYSHTDDDEKRKQVNSVFGKMFK